MAVFKFLTKVIFGVKNRETKKEVFMIPILIVLGIGLMLAGVATASGTKGKMTKKGCAGVGVYISGAFTLLGGFVLPATRNELFLVVSLKTLATMLLGASLLAFVLLLISEKKKVNKPVDQAKDDGETGVWIFAVTMIIILGFSAAVYFLIPSLGLGRLGFN
jgi:hypothetical protein